MPWSGEKSVRAVAWTVLIVLAGVQAWAYRHVPSGADSFSYLDVADTYAVHGWWAGINGYWSPLYSWILIPVLHGAHLGPEHELAAVHAANLVIFALALGAFELVLREISRSHGPWSAGARQAIAWRIAAYAAFAWGCLDLAGPRLVTPDLLVAALTCLSTALVLRARREGGGWGTMAALGATCGVAYLAKAAMFPAGLVTLAVGGAVAARGDWRRGLGRGALALLAFATVSAPFAVSLSVVKHRPTFGGVGALAYVWFVNGARKYVHWQGGDGYGVPVHPTRRVLAEPPVYEFATPVRGSYPPWYDPTWWHEGVKPRFDFGRTARAVYVDLATLALRTWWVAIPLLALCGLLAAVRWLRAPPLEYWLPYVPLAATVAMYSAVFLDARFVGAQLSLIVVGALAGFAPTARTHRWSAVALPALAAAILVARLLWLSVGLAPLAARGGMPNMGWEVARELHAQGVPEGARVGLVGSGLAVFWARPARVRIVAEAPDARRFWSASPAEQAAVLSALTRAGASAIVAGNAPGCGGRPGWRALGWNTCLWMGDGLAAGSA
jgi:hypothetical protein